MVSQDLEAGVATLLSRVVTCDLEGFSKARRTVSEDSELSQTFRKVSEIAWYLYAHTQFEAKNGDPQCLKLMDNLSSYSSDWAFALATLLQSKLTKKEKKKLRDKIRYVKTGYKSKVKRTKSIEDSQVQPSSTVTRGSSFSTAAADKSPTSSVYSPENFGQTPKDGTSTSTTPVSRVAPGDAPAQGPETRIGEITSASSTGDGLPQVPLAHGAVGSPNSCTAHGSTNQSFLLRPMALMDNAALSATMNSTSQENFLQVSPNTASLETPKGPTQSELDGLQRDSAYPLSSFQVTMGDSGGDTSDHSILMTSRGQELPLPLPFDLPADGDVHCKINASLQATIRQFSRGCAQAVVRHPHPHTSSGEDVVAGISMTFPTNIHTRTKSQMVIEIAHDQVHRLAWDLYEVPLASEDGLRYTPMGERTRVTPNPKTTLRRCKRDAISMFGPQVVTAIKGNPEFQAEGRALRDYTDCVSMVFSHVATEAAVVCIEMTFWEAAFVIQEFDIGLSKRLT